MNVVIAVVIAIVLSVAATYFGLNSYNKSQSKNKVGNAEEKARQIIDDAVKTAEETKREKLLEAQEDFTNDALFSILKSYSAEKGIKINTALWPVRTAVSGKAVTPAGASEIMEILGKEESLARVRAAIEKLKAES